MTIHRHMYYNDPKTLDLAAMQKAALKLSVGDKFGSPPIDVTIHFHKHGENCPGKKHEDYYAPKEED